MQSSVTQSLPTHLPAYHVHVCTPTRHFSSLNDVVKKSQFESGGSAHSVRGSAHPIPTVRFRFVVQANTSKNRTELNFGIPIIMVHHRSHHPNR
jgi:hypothetical protein